MKYIPCVHVATGIQFLSIGGCGRAHTHVNETEIEKYAFTTCTYIDFKVDMCCCSKPDLQIAHHCMASRAA